MANVAVTRKESIFDQIEQLRHRIEQRAYELFRGRGGASNPLADWLAAEEELVWKPAVELREKDGTFFVKAAVPGIEAKDVNVEITAEDLVIKAAATHRRTHTEGEVHLSEFAAADLFRSVHFPRAVDPGKAKAEYRNGLLTVSVPATSAKTAGSKAA